LTQARVTSGGDNNFDALRLAAALAVVVAHAFPLSHGACDREFLYWFSGGRVNLGSLAVAVFFVISGFLVTKSQETSPTLRAFLMRRVLRIFPGLAVVVVLTAFVLGPLVSALPPAEYFSRFDTYFYLRTLSLRSVQFTLPGVFADNPNPLNVNGSLWTLWHEFVCYLVVFAFGALGPLRWQRFLLLGSASLVTRVLFDYVPSLTALDAFWNYRHLSIFCGYFCAGALLYLLRSRIPLRGTLAGLSFLMLVLAAYAGNFDLVFAVAGSYLTIFLAFARWPAFADVGKYGDLSYGIFIYGYPIQQTVARWLLPTGEWWQNLFWSLPPTFLCAFISWRWVERPALLWGRARERPVGERGVVQPVVERGVVT
jgi:peptidoglycan/LPS O-acetylase OafA/YrhL